MAADREFLQGVAMTMTDRDLWLAVLAIDPDDRERKWKVGVYITELSRRDIRLAMAVYREWKKRGGERI